MPAAASAPPLPVLYQLRATPTGSWRVRVFNLPEYRPGQAPELPFLTELAAWTPGGPVREWHPDGSGRQLRVLRLAGADRAGLTRLLASLRAHGICLAAAAPQQPARRRAAHN